MPTWPASTDCAQHLHRPLDLPSRSAISPRCAGGAPSARARCHKVNPIPFGTPRPTSGQQRPASTSCAGDPRAIRLSAVSPTPRCSAASVRPSGRLLSPSTMSLGAGRTRRRPPGMPPTSTPTGEVLGEPIQSAMRTPSGAGVPGMDGALRRLRRPTRGRIRATVGGRVRPGARSARPRPRRGRGADGHLCRSRPDRVDHLG